MRELGYHVLLVVMLVAGMITGCDSDKAGGSPDSGTNQDAAAQMDAASQPDAATQVDGSSDPDGTTPDPDAAADPDAAVIPDGGPDGGGSGDLVIQWSSVTMWANCMPMVPPDPMNGTIELIYDNTAGSAPATATVTGARMIFQVATNPTLTFDVTPTAVGPVAAGASTPVTHTKVPNSGTGVTGVCGYCSGTAVYEITVDVGGQPQVVTSPPQTVNCAY